MLEGIVLGDLQIYRRHNMLNFLNRHVIIVYNVCLFTFVKFFRQFLF